MNFETDKQIFRFQMALNEKFGVYGGFYYSTGNDLPIKTNMFSLNGYFDYLRNTTVSSAGCARQDWNAVIAPSFAESLERYSLGVVPPKSETRNASVDEFESEVHLTFQEIAELQGLHPMQFSISKNYLRPVEQDTKFTWRRAKRLIDESEIWIPDEAVSLRRNKYFEVTTNGCAIQVSDTQATIKACLEFMERDSFLYMWWRKENLKFIDFKESFLKLDPQLFRAFGPWIECVHVAYYPNIFNIPIFYCMFRSFNNQGHPAFCLSAGAHLNPAKALIAGLNELAASTNHKFSIFKPEMIEKYNKLYNYDEQVNSFYDHTYYYMFDEFVKKIHFIEQLDRNIFDLRFSEIQNQETGNQDSDLAILKNAFTNAGLNPIKIDQTSLDVRSIGLHVVRICDPKNIDLNAVHSQRRWGKTRLFCNKIKSIKDLNQLPHPFP